MEKLALVRADVGVQFALFSSAMTAARTRAPQAGGVKGVFDPLGGLARAP
jgi:hypothetical protein